MGRWTISDPAGQEQKELVASRIRTLKDAQEEALSAGGHFPGPDPTAPVYITSINAGTTAARPAASSDFAGRWYFNRDTGRIERDSGSAYDPITSDKDIVPSGSKLLWIEASAPTGWTQVTSSVDDKLCRLTNSTGGGTGGSHSISSPPTHTHTIGATNVTHTHGMTQALITAQDSNIAPKELVTGDFPTTASNSTSLSHAHSLTSVAGFSPKYVDGIVCSKDAW